MINVNKAVAFIVSLVVIYLVFRVASAGWKRGETVKN